MFSKRCLLTIILFLGSTFPSLSLGDDYDVVLEAPSPTDWGTWGPLENCLDSNFISGMQLKTESSQGAFTDDTALNGVKFFCRPFQAQEELSRHKSIIQDNSSITSDSHNWGSWGSEFHCGEFELATGFQMRFEPSQTVFSDDTAGNNVRIFCNTGKRQLTGDGQSWGDWKEPRHCSPKMGMCGLSTQIYRSSGADDETAMDSLRVKCCDIPNPAVICVPTDEWELVIECDNLEAISPTTCTYQKRVGTSNYTSTSEHHWEIMNSYTELGFGLGGAAGPLLLNFNANLGNSQETGYNWTSTSSEMWNEEVTTTVSFEVPPRVKSQLFQVFGKCGIYGARAVRFKKVDTEDNGSGLLEKTVTFFDA